MFILKIATTIWLALIALIMISGATLSKEADTNARLLSLAIMFGQILAIAFMWQ